MLSLTLSHKTHIIIPSVPHYNTTKQPTSKDTQNPSFMYAYLKALSHLRLFLRVLDILD